jgi:hypothetical protein
VKREAEEGWGSDLHEAVLAIVSYLLGCCPGCGKKSFGNVDVYSTHVLRGCGACKYKESVRLPPIRKKILYLDQFFLSHVFRGSDARFVEAASRIEKLAALQLLLVPYSSVHEDETHQWERHAELFKFIKATSRGHEFLPAYDVERIQLEKAFDAWLARSPAEFVSDDWDVFRDNVHVWEGYYRIDVGRYTGNRDLIRSLKEQSIQALVATFDGWRQSKRTFEQDLLEEHAAAASNYVRSFGELLLGEGDFSAFLNAPIISMMVLHLLHHIPETTPRDRGLQIVAEFLSSNHFRKTPYHDLSARIYASLKAVVKEGAYTNAQKAVQRLSGFYYDVKHIATYAPYCDALVVDQLMAQLITRPTVAIKERYGVNIFSLNNWDDMMTWLDRVEQAMSEEHKQALVQAYPKLMARLGS